MLVSDPENGHSRKWQTMRNMRSLLSREKEPKPQETKKSESNGSYFALFRTLEGAQSWFILSCGVILAIVAGAPLPIIGVIFSKIVNEFPPSESEVQNRVDQLLGVATAYLVVTWGWAFCWGVVGQRISKGLRTRMVDRALGLDQTYYETQCPDITGRLTVDAQIVQAGTAEKVGFFIQSCSYFVVSFIVGFILNAKLTGILIAAIIPPMALAVIATSFILNKFSKEASESTSSAASIAEGAIRAVEVVQAFDAFDVLTADHQSHLEHAMKTGVKRAVTSAVLLATIFFVAYSANALAFYEGSNIVRESSSSGGAGTVYAIVFLILDASFVIGQAGPFIQSFHNAASAGSRIFQLINYPDIPIDAYSEEGVLANAETFAFDKEIVFEDVSFAYPARSTEEVLDSVSFKIKMGSSIGVVGSSGSGKSTIAALLLRLYDPTKGKILMDGQEMSAFNISSLRHQIALVDQDPAVFSGTLFSNLKHGYKGPEISEDELRERCIKAAKEADAWSFIEVLPDGLDTWLGEPSGTKLSGGQKQRLCLARALVGDPTILVLDEATSALDTISEAAILSNLGKLRSKGNQTTVMIAHRLASVKDADSILVMGKGKILEQGDHETLMAKDGGAYRQLVEAQQIGSSNASQSSLASGHESESTLVDEQETKEIEEVTLPQEMEIELKPEDIYSTSTIMRRCLSLSRPRILFTILALLGTLITGALILGESIIFGHLVTLINGAVPAGQINFFCLMFFVIACAAFLGYVTSGSCFGIVSEHLIMRTRDISLRTVLRQDMEWFLQPGRSVSSLTAVISSDAGHLSGLSGVIIGTLVSAMVSVIGGAILGLIVAWRISIVLLATAPVVVLAGFFRLQILAKVEDKSQQAYTDAASLATEACTNIRTVAALSLEKSVSERFSAAVEKNEKATFKFTAFGNLLLAFALSVTYYVYSLAYYWGSKNVREGRYSAEAFFIVLPAILFSAQAAGQVFSLAPDIGRARGAAARVFALHDQKPSIDTRSVTEKTKLPQETEKSKGTGRIRFEHVDLAYASRASAPIFTDLNLDIKSGETVALVGRSGAGKSSTISLIERFYDPTTGTIYLDDVDIRDVPVAEHRARISLVSQDPDLFAGSVAFNVGLGAKPGHKATQQEIEDACKAVGIHEFITGLADGYETLCGSNGSQLSGGQKQRVAIARAYIRDPEILLLDEATSALDSNSEAQIQEAIMRVSKKRTTIMIAHRLTTVQHADRILVFDKGKVVEEGKHRDLMHNGGIYEMMIKAQSLG